MCDDDAVPFGHPVCAEFEITYNTQRNLIHDIVAENELEG